MERVKKKKSRPSQWEKITFLIDHKTRSRNRALFIGISYHYASSINHKIKHLKCAIGDTQKAEKSITRNWHPQIVKLYDTEGYIQPTRKNIIDALQWLVQDSKRGDVMYLHICGHGEVSSSRGRKNLFLPCDVLESDTISSSVFYQTLTSKIPPGALLLVVFDTCNAGETLRLPYVWNGHHFTRNPNFNYEMDRGQIITLSACQHHEKANDLYSLTRILLENFHRTISWETFKQIKNRLGDDPNLPNQTPQIECAHIFDVKERAFVPLEFTPVEFTTRTITTRKNNKNYEKCVIL